MPTTTTKRYKVDEYATWLDYKQTGIHEATLRSLTLKKILTPVEVRRGDSRRRIKVYDPEQIARVKLQRAQRLRLPDRDLTRGEQAALAFEMFAAGRSKADVVIALRIEPDGVESLWDQWLVMGGGDLVLTPTAFDRVAPYLGHVQSVTDLVDRIVARYPVALPGVDPVVVAVGDRDGAPDDVGTIDREPIDDA